MRSGRFLGGFQPGTPHPAEYRVSKGGLACLWSLRGVFWRKLYETNVAGHPQFSGGGAPFLTPNLDLEGPRPHILEPWSLTMEGSS